jgi:hypothetical protein
MWVLYRNPVSAQTVAINFDETRVWEQTIAPQGTNFANCGDVSASRTIFWLPTLLLAD